jgi:hypothetical protein
VPISVGMAVSRPFLLAVLGLALLAATLMASRNAQQTSDASKPVTQTSVAKPPKSKAPASKAPASKAAPHASKPAPEKHSTTSSVAGQHAAPRAQAAPRHTPLSKPAAVARAIGNRKVVVLAFFQPGADDQADKAAVGAVRARHLAAVFTDGIRNIGRYGPVVGALGINQAPAIVIVDSKRHARLIEGYVDPETLTQEVSDARK